MEPQCSAQCSHYPDPYRSSPYHSILRSILILSSHLRLFLPSGLFPSGFPNKSYMHSCFPYVCYKLFLSHHPLLDHFTRPPATWQHPGHTQPFYFSLDILTSLPSPHFLLGILHYLRNMVNEERRNILVHQVEVHNSELQLLNSQSFGRSAQSRRERYLSVSQWLYSPCGPWPLSSFVIHTQSVGLVVRGNSPSQGRYLYTGRQKHRINRTEIHAMSGIWIHDLSVRASEDISCLRPRDRPLWSALLLLIYLWSWALLGKLPIVQPLKNNPAYYGTRRFITVFTRALHQSLS
jgi:hypothetical protein